MTLRGESNRRTRVGAQGCSPRSVIWVTAWKLQSLDYAVGLMTISIDQLKSQ